MGPTKGQHWLPPPNMRMTTLWATQVLLLLTHDSYCVRAHLRQLRETVLDDEMIGLLSTLVQTSGTETGIQLNFSNLLRQHVLSITPNIQTRNPCQRELKFPQNRTVFGKSKLAFHISPS